MNRFSFFLFFKLKATASKKKLTFEPKGDCIISKFVSKCNSADLAL
jgi:hypothetical protein